MLEGAITDKVTPELSDQSSGLSFQLPPAPVEAPLPMLQPEPSDVNKTNFMDVFDQTLAKPASWEAKTAPDTFDWDKSNIDRYIQSPNFKEAGFNPFAAPVTIDGKTYDANELRYNHMQSMSDTFWNGTVGGGALMLDTAWRQFTQWGDTIKGLGDLMSGQGWEKAKRDFVGTDEEQMQANKEQQEIMNKYAIFHGDYEDHHLFSKEYLFDNIQQFGLGAGQGLEMLAEVAATWGIGAAFNLMRAPMIAAKAIEGAEVAQKTMEAAKLGKTIETAAEAAKSVDAITLPNQAMSVEEKADMALKIQQGSDMSNKKPFVDAVWRGMSNVGKTPIPGSGIVGGIGDIGQAYRAGASGIGAWKGGIGTMAKELSLFNMAATHGKLLAFTTYGQQYADLINQYEAANDGQAPDAKELARIRNNAWMAAGDNFTLNLGLIMAMGKIEWGGLYSKFGSVKSMLRNAETTAAEGGESNIFTVKGELKDQEGVVGQRAYEKVTGMFPAIRTLNMIRKDFGLGTALWEVAKKGPTSVAARFEVMEGLHMVLQNTSDKVFREYYKNQYNGGTDINGHSFLDAAGSTNWPDEIRKEFANSDPGGGLKTFIMGATNGLFMTPIHHIGTWANERIMTKVSPDVKDAAAYRKAAVAENLKMMNTWYKDPNNLFNAHIDAIKTTGKAAQGMSDAVDQQNKYAFHNSKNDLFAKTVSTFIKTGNYQSFLYTLKSMGNMDEKAFYEAFPAMKPEDGATPKSPKAVVDEIAKDVTSYYNRWQKLTDQFSGFVRPEYFEGRGAKELKDSDQKRTDTHQRLASEYGDVKWGDEHESLPETEKDANKVRQDEYVSKANKVESDYERETRNNRYHQELMKKRVLDESIELLATTDFHAHEAVKRMLGVVSQMSDTGKFPGVAEHAQHIVNVLGDKAATLAEMYRLNELAKILESGGQAPSSNGAITKDVKIQLQSYKDQLKHLSSWVDNLALNKSHDELTDDEKVTLKEGGAPLPEKAEVAENLRKSYEDYINSLNSGIATTRVDIGQPQFDSSFQLLMEHMNLAKDYKHYMDAINVLANPKGFNQLHDKIYDAMKRNTFELYLEQRAAIKGYELHKDVRAQLDEVAKEEDARKAEEQRIKYEGESAIQAQRLSTMLSNVENDIKALNDEKATIEPTIEEAETRVKEIEGDLNAAKQLLTEADKSQAGAKKEFRRMEQSLRGKLKYLQANLEPLVARRDALNKALNVFNKMKDHYSKAITDIEAKKRPFESFTQLSDAHLQQVKDLSFTDKPNLEGMIQHTKAELDSLSARVDYFQKVVDSTEKAINDLFNVASYTLLDAYTVKGGASIYAEKETERLIEKFENYKQDLADAKAARNEVLQKYDRLNITKVSREALSDMEPELHYIRVIKSALEESGEEPDMEEPEHPTAEHTVGDQQEEPVTEPEETEEEVKAKEESKQKINDNIIDHFTFEAPLSTEAQAEVDKLPTDVKAALEDLPQAMKENPTVMTDEFARDQAEKLLKKAQDSAISTVSYPQYVDVPYIEDRGDKGYYIMNPNHTSTGRSFTLKADANAAIKEEVLKLHPEAKEVSVRQKAIYEERNTELKKLGDTYRASWQPGPAGEAPENPMPRLDYVHTVNTIERRADRQILDLQGSMNEKDKQLKALDWFKKRLVESIEDITPKTGGDGTKKYRVNKYDMGNSFSTKEEAVASIDKYIDVKRMEVEQQHTPIEDRNFVEEQRTEDELYKDSPILANDKESKSSRINYDDMNSLSPLYDVANKVYKKSELKEFLTKHSPEEISNGLTIDVAPSSNVGKISYPFIGNPDVRMRAPKFTYIMKFNGEPFALLRPNGAYYEFNLSKDTQKGGEHWITTDSPEFRDDNVFGVQQFARFFNYPTDESAGIHLAKFKDDILKANLLGQKLGEGTLSNDELRSKVSFNVSTGLNFSNENKSKGPLKLPSSFADIEASGLEFAGVLIDNGMLPQLGKAPRYAGGRGSQAEEAALAERSPVPTENQGQYTAAFRLPNGDVKWLQLSPVELGQAEADNRIGQIKLILSKVGADEEISNTELGNINKILESVFIATNPYSSNVDPLSQKVKLSGRISVDNKGEANMTIFVKDTYNLPSEKETAVVKLGKFNDIRDAEDLVQKLNVNLANYGLNHQNAPFVRNIVKGNSITIESLKEQIDDRDISTIKKMDTNVHVDRDKVTNAIIPNSAITVTPSWSYNVQTPKAEPAIPIVKEVLPPKQVEKSNARNIDDIAKELEIAISKGDNDKINELSKELANMHVPSTPLSEIMDEETDNPIDPTVIEKAGGQAKRMSAAERQEQRRKEEADRERIRKEQEEKGKVPKYVDATEHFNQKSIENIDKFRVWAAKNLPGSISVKDMGILANNLKAGRITVGQFISYLDGANVKGRIEVYGNTPFKYHEAFHGVFRLLLDQKHINSLMREADMKNPVTEAKLQAFRDLGYNYGGKEMIDRFYEEWMADEFDKWKMNQKAPTTLIGKFFKYITDLFRELKAKLGGSQMEGLFYEINRGKYKNAKLADNQFTDRGFVSQSVPVAKAIELGTQELPNGQIVTRYLPQNVADRLSATIAGQVLRELQKGRGNENVIVNQIFENYRNTLDPIANEDFYNEVADRNFSNAADMSKWFGKLDDHFQTFDDPKARQLMKESVAAHLRNYGVKLDLENDMLEDLIDKSGKGAESFDDSPFEYGGFGNLNSKVRQFIGSATYELDHDDFFNTTFRDGTPITQSVHVGKVYNGLLRALGNQTDPVSALQNLVSFALDTENTNPETTHFVKYLFNEAGFNYQAFSEGVDINDCFDGENSNPTLLNSIVQGFNQQGLNYLFTGFDDRLGFRTSYANTKDSAYYQVKMWGEHFSTILNKGITDANTQPLSDLHDLFTVNKMSTAVIMKDVLDISRDMKKMTGVDLHPDFLLYSILKNKEAENSDVLDASQKKFIASHPVTDVIEPSVLQKVIDQLKSKNKDIFSKTGLDGEDRNFTDSFLNKWATGNANFDEKVNTLNFKSADRKDRYSYIQQNTIGQLVTSMNDPDWMSTISDTGFLQDIAGNYLLSNNDYQRILQQRKLKLVASDGMREMASLGEDGERSVDKKSAEGVTFGKMNTRELMAYLLGLYNIEGQPDCVIYRGSRPDFYMSAIPIRVNAEKKSLYSVKLPIIDAITSFRGGDFQMSKEAMPILMNMVQREVSRILTLNKQLDALGPDGKLPGHELIEGWNTGDRAKMRGLQLDLTKSWFSDDLKKEIEQGAMTEDFKLDSLKARIEKEINSHFKEQVENFAREMEKEGLITKNDEGEYENVLAPEYLFNGYGELKLSYVDSDTEMKNPIQRWIPSKISDKVHIKNGRFINNLAQVMMNHFINCTEFNNLLHGDESKLFKNITEPTKRESSNVGTYNNIRTILKDESLGIMHSIDQIHGLCLADTEVPTQFGKGAGTIKTDDGMMWITDKGLRYTLFGTCKLDAFKARLLDNLMSGKSVSEAEFFGGKDRGQVVKGLKERGAFNSMKLLFADGRVTLKCSAFTLTPELTSIYNKATGQWDIPMSYRKEAHMLRTKMEAYENGNRWDEAGNIIMDSDGNPATFHAPTIVYAYPKSVSKTLTRNVANSVDDVTHTHFEPLDPKFMGNQLENPSNKIVGTEKSQPDYLITTGHPNTKLPITINGRAGTVRGAIDEFHEAKYLKMKNDWEGAINKLFTAKDGSRIKLGDKINLDKVNVNIADFLDHIRENLEMEGTDAQLLGFMETRDGKPVYNINYPGILPKVTANFFTLLSKGVLQGRVPELSLALVSGARGLGLKVKEVKSIWTQQDIDKYSKQGHTKVTQALLGQPKTWRVVTDNEYKANHNKFKNAKGWTDKANRTFANIRPGDYVIDDLRHNFPEFHMVDGKEAISHYISEYVRPAHFAEEMKGVQSALEHGFAMRIPSDAKHTMINVKMVDTMPVQLGSVGIFPHELIEIAGPDFDIDKQYVHIPDTYVNDKGTRVAYGNTTTTARQFEEYKQYLGDNNKDFRHLVSEGIRNDADTIKASIDRLNLSKGQSDLVKQIVGVSNERDMVDYLGDNDEIAKTDLAMNMNDLLRKHKVDAKQEVAINKAIKEIRNRYQNIALLKMGLPATIEEFTKAGADNLNNGVQNNRMLNAKMALLGNKEAIKQQDTPTSTQPIKDIITDFTNKFSGENSDYEKQLHAQLTEKNTDINSVAGMINDRIASKVGVEAIGAVANANMIYAVGFENGLKLRNDNLAITIDGKTYNSFTNSTAIGHPNEVIADSISSLLNLFADQPKDRDASKLGLDTKSAGFATYEIAKGMPKETALLYMMQPATVEYMRKTDQLDGELKTDDEKREFKSNYLKAKIKELKDDGAKLIDKFTSADLEKNIKEGGTDKNIQLTVLDNLKKMETQGTTFFKVNRILKLIQGHDATIEEFNELSTDLREIGIIVEPNGSIRKMNEEEWEGLTDGPDAPCVDMRSIFMDKKHFISHYIRSVGQLNTLLPAMFLEATPLFKNMMSAVSSNLRVPFGTEGGNFMRKVKYDLIGYMGLRAYMNFLKGRGNASDIANLVDLDNNLIYAQEGGENRSIVNITEDLKQRVQDAGISNAFLNFLFPNDDYAKTNGLNRVDTNTWTTLSEQQQQSLIESFVDLYANNYTDKNGETLDTHQAAQSMFNYLLVKDGGQFVSGTFIKFMPPFIFKDFMDRIGEVNDLLSGKSKNYELFGKDVTKTTLLQDFLKGYATHSANEYNIRRVRSDSDYLFPDQGSTQMENYNKDFAKLNAGEKEIVENYDGYKKVLEEVDNGLKINMFNGIRENRVAAKFNKVERLLRDQNWFYLNRLGFQFSEGKSVEFPYSIRYGKSNDLYTLVNVERRMPDEEHKMGKVSVDQMLKEGEYIPSGVIATYSKDSFKGSKQQFAAGFALPNIPMTDELQGTPREKKIAAAVTNAQESAAKFDEKYVVVKNPKGEGVIVYDKGDMTNPLPGNYKNKYEAIQASTKGDLRNAEPVVPSGKFTTSEWREKLNDMWKEKADTPEWKLLGSKEFALQAKGMYDSMKDKFSDEDILQKIKNCL